MFVLRKFLKELFGCNSKHTQSSVPTTVSGRGGSSTEDRRDPRSKFSDFRGEKGW